MNRVSITPSREKERKQAFPLSSKNLSRLCTVRFVLVVMEVLSITYVATATEFSINGFALTVAIIMQAVVILFTFRRLQWPLPVSDTEWFGHLALDVLSLSLFLFFLGGATNPISICFLIPVVVASALLPSLYHWGLTLLVIAAFTVLLLVSDPIFPMSSYFYGVWIIFAVTAVLISTQVVKMAQTMHDQENQLAEKREEQLRDELSIALAIHSDSLEPVQPVSITELLDSIIKQWKWLRPVAQPVVTIQQGEEIPSVNSDASLIYAMLVLLENAVNKSQDNIEIQLAWDTNFCTFRILDEGPELAIEEAESSGTLFFTTKSEGRGLGLNLSHGTIERLQGKVSIYWRAGQGKVTEVMLPLINPEN